MEAARIAIPHRRGHCFGGGSVPGTGIGKEEEEAARFSQSSRSAALICSRVPIATSRSSLSSTWLPGGLMRN